MHSYSDPCRMCNGYFGFVVGEAEFYSILIQCNIISLKFFGTVKIFYNINTYDT